MYIALTVSRVLPVTLTRPISYELRLPVQVRSLPLREPWQHVHDHDLRQILVFRHNHEE